MPQLSVNGIRLYAEEAGSGTPLVFVHESAGDYRTWLGQLRYFGRRYRAVTYSARGYRPSDVPAAPSAYSQERQIEDLRGLLDALGIAAAHVCGLSMGSYTALLFALKYPARTLSLTVAGTGYGSGPHRAAFHKGVDGLMARVRRDGMAKFAQEYALTHNRVQLRNKDPRGWAEFRDQFIDHDAAGYALSFDRVVKRRPSLYDLEAELRACELPVLILAGDEDDGSLEPSLFLKRVLPRAGLEVFPVSGHCLNLEEPERFNRSLLAFLSAVDGGTWPRRDARAAVAMPVAKRLKASPAKRRQGTKTASARRHKGTKARTKRS
jgi:pimeloyl-ACP methyl ester carboxylesterase